MFSCGDDEPESKSGYFEKGKGVFICNEGIFTHGNASIYYYDWSEDSLHTNIYENSNNEKLGDVLQSMNIVDDRAYLVVNNSSIINEVSIRDFKKIKTFTGFNSPRYILPVNEEKAYVSDLYSGVIYVISLKENKIIKELKTGQWTETWALAGNRAFVTCPWFFSSELSKKILVLDTEKDEIIDSLFAGPNPNRIEIDSNNKLWVLCGGNGYAGIHGGLYKFDVSTGILEDSLIFENPQSLYNNAMAINKNKDTIFIVNNGVYTLDVNQSDMKLTKMITLQDDFVYGMNIDDDRNLLYLSINNDNTKGEVKVYNMQGKLIKTINAGYYPNSVLPY